MGENKTENTFSLDYMNSIMDNLDEGIYITDNEANTVYLNHSYERISGLARMEMLGENMRDLVEKGVVSMSGSLYVLEKRKKITMEQSFKTGKRALITSIPIFDSENDSIIMVITVVKETTQLYEIKKDLKIQKDLCREYRLMINDLKSEINGDPEIISCDRNTQDVLRIASGVAPIESPVLILGEAGSGKSRLAEYIHRHSQRSERRFLRVDFSLLSGTDINSYFFGGTDLRSGRYQLGVLESLEGGTLYIDEICDVPAEFLGKLAMLLHNDNIVLGDGKLKRLDIRIIAGSRYQAEYMKEDLCAGEEIINELSLFTLKVMPLRERRDDIIPLADGFIKQYNERTGRNISISREGCRKLFEYSWPNNITELKNVIQRAAILCEGDIIQKGDIVFAKTGVEGAGEHVSEFEEIDLKEETARFEAGYIKKAFDKYGNVRDAARSLGIDSSTFVRKRQRYRENGWM